MRLSLEEGAGANVYEMKEGYIVDEIEPATSSILSRVRRTTMRKIVKGRALLCNLYDVDFRNLTEEHEICIG